jgi:hypothetical protein
MAVQSGIGMILITQVEIILKYDEYKTLIFIASKKYFLSGSIIPTCFLLLPSNKYLTHVF